MAGSMVAGWFAFDHLGEPGGLGVITAFAVNLALAAWIRISARLRALGITSGLGVTLEVVTMTMALFLHVGAAVFQRVTPSSVTATVLLGIAHTFLPIVLVLITLAGGDAQLKLLRTQRDQETRGAAEHEARRRAQRDVEHGAASTEPDEARRLQSVATGTHAGTPAGDSRRGPHRPVPEGTPSPPSRPRRDTVPTVPSPLSPAGDRDTSGDGGQGTSPGTGGTDLLDRARDLRAHKAAQGQPRGWQILKTELPCTEREARDLVRQLNAEPHLAAVRGTP